MVEWATAPTNGALAPGSPYTVRTPTDPTEAVMCRNQLVHSTGLHQQFSILGIALTLGLGGVMIVLGTVASIVVSRLQTGRETEYRNTQWALEDKLQLQRVAYEGFGFGGVWERKLEDVPTISSAGVLLPSSSDAFLENGQEEDGGK